MGRMYSTQEFRGKEWAALETKDHSSLEGALEVEAETVEEWQLQGDLLKQEKEEVPLAVPKVLQEQEREKAALLDGLCQLQFKLTQCRQQLKQLRQEVNEEREKGQNIKDKLQAELQEAQRKMKAVEKKHKEELERMQEEMNVLLQQREALQPQINVGSAIKGAAAAASSKEASAPRPEDPSTSSVPNSNLVAEKLLERREVQDLKLLYHMVRRIHTGSFSNANGRTLQQSNQGSKGDDQHHFSITFSNASSESDSE